MPIEAGTRLGRYIIQSVLGAGGMGEVYRATDTRLGRDVAIKVLPAAVAADPSRLQRFELEARAIASLSHPNILAIFDVGTGDVPYLVTELLDGETLRARIAQGRLPVSAVLDVARQLVSGIAAAHGRGIVHRDLKPDNLFITREGVVKILDFGLARRAVTSTASDLEATQAPATTEGNIVGTVGYMAPEQVRGAPVDHRADIFAAGTVLYEMVTGVRAFRGDSPADTMSAVLREQPPALVLDEAHAPALVEIIRRCLEKQPGDRFQSAVDLQAALDAARAVPVARADDVAPSIAVLPFTDMSAGRDQAYFCEGMAEEIITALARVNGLRVAARTSTFHARSTTDDLGRVAQVLGVRHLLEGSVRTAGGRLRVTAQVVDASDGRAVWSDRFDGDLSDVFAIQDTIAVRIVDALETRLVGGAGAVAQVRRQYTPKVEAYELYLKGLHHRYTTYNLIESLRAFEGAIQIDPGYADALVGVGHVAAVLSNFGFRSPRESRALARSALDRALAIDPHHPKAFATLGWWTALHEWNWREAEELFHKALSLDPSCLEAHAFYGVMCAALQRDRDVVERSARLIALDPLSPWTHGVTALMYNVLGRPADADRESRVALDLRSDSMLGLWCAGEAKRSLGQHGESIALFERAAALTPSANFLLAQLGVSFAAAGQPARADDIARTLDARAADSYVGPAWRAALAGAVGRLDEAFEWCERAYDEGSPLLPFLGAQWWDPLRKDPRFAALAARIGLPPSVTAR